MVNDASNLHEQHEQLPASPPAWKGTDRYQIVDRIGQGGMGVVYEAFDRERRQKVALKTLLHFDSAGLYLFKQEFRTVADVQHTNLVRLHELVAADEDHVFFTMELVRGVDFVTYARGTTPPHPGRGPCQADLERVRSAVRQLAEGVHALHAARKVHRDIKPSNVLVTKEGRVVLLDFGVATEVSRVRAEVPAGSGEVVGTACYMAPEQAGDDPATPASDWYSVGVMLYEALVGRPPFIGTLIDVLTMKSQRSAPAPSEQVDGIPPDLDALCQDLMRLEPAARPTGDEVLLRLGGPRDSAMPPARLGDTDARMLVGRERHLAKMREAFEACRMGRPVAVQLTGDSGMGKTTLAHSFLDGLVERGEVLALRGRAYERESVPYKAVDSIVDALSRYLVTMAEEGEPIALPKDVGALARVFPVLRRVNDIEAAHEADAADAMDARTRAFQALRELLLTIAARQPLALFIDDAHWGDGDSAALMLEVLRGTGALRLLLIMTSPPGEVRSPFLDDLRERWPVGVPSNVLPVGPLDADESRTMALALLGASDEAAQQTASAVAREAHGSPFLIEELVRSNAGPPPPSGARLRAPTLDEMVGRRLESLSNDERLMLELIAVAGRPLSVPTLASAAGGGESIDEAIARASALRFVRTGMREGAEVVEASHNRIREALIARLPEGQLRSHHGRLAQALGGAGDVTAEAVAHHWLGAGEPARAVEAAVRGAEGAVAKLAFEQAARLLRLALDNSDGGDEQLRPLRARLAEVLQLAGRHAESARTFLDAARGAPPDRQVELRRAAAEQLLASGHIDQGTKVLHDVLDAVGMRAPVRLGAQLFWLVAYRLWLAIIGLGFKGRDESEVSRADCLRVEALYTVATGFGLVDPLLAACMQARHLIEALRYGHRFQVLRAVCLEASHLATDGKPESARVKALLQVGRDLAATSTDEGRSYYDGVRGITVFQQGRWKEARDLLLKWDGAVFSRASVANVRIFASHSLFYLGELAENARRINRLCAEADAHGALYTSVSLRTSGAIRLMLNSDEPERARRMVEDSLAQWSHKRFFVQQWQAMVYSPDIDLYEGDGEAAYQRFMRDLPALQSGLLMRSGFIRVMTAFARGKLAVASIAKVPERKEERLAEARAQVRRLEREHAPWAAGLASLLLAIIENAAGNRAAAVAALRRANDRLLATDTMAFAVPAQVRLGQLLGGDEGRDMADTAMGKLVSWGIRDPERWLQVYLPGTWG